MISNYVKYISNKKMITSWASYIKIDKIYVWSKCFVLWKAIDDD